MVKKQHLALLTFLAVFLSILAVGGLVMPLLLDRLERTYVEIQADVNRRQAVSMAQFIHSRLARGATKKEILADFQASIEGTDADRGYVCLIDQANSGFLCHPMQSMNGLNISVKNAEFDISFIRQNPIPWEIAIKNPESRSGLLLINNATMEEVVHSEVIPELGWVVSSHENTQRVQDEIASYRIILLLGSAAFALLLAFPVSFAGRRVSRSYEKRIEESNVMLADEREKSDQLLLSILPKAIADRMKQGEKNIVNHFSKVAILFCDIAGFTELSSRNPAEKIANLLSVLFSQFDKLCTKHGVEKIKTIGDAYLAACGLPLPDMDPVAKIVPMALEMRDFVASQPWGIQVRIGIHVGEAAAGVIGTHKFSYDLWGDAVNVAARLESTGLPGKIHISEPIKESLGENGWSYEDQGEKELKGKGKVRTWLVEPRQ